jgi:hypothetical protein
MATWKDEFEEFSYWLRQPNYFAQDITMNNVAEMIAEMEQHILNVDDKLQQYPDNVGLLLVRQNYLRMTVGLMFAYESGRLKETIAYKKQHANERIKNYADMQGYLTQQFEHLPVLEKIAEEGSAEHYFGMMMKRFRFDRMPSHPNLF